MLLCSHRPSTRVSLNRRFWGLGQHGIFRFRTVNPPISLLAVYFSIPNPNPNPMPTRPNKAIPIPLSHPSNLAFSNTTHTPQRSCRAAAFIVPTHRSHPTNFSSSEKVSSRAESYCFFYSIFLHFNIRVKTKANPLHDLHISTAQNPSSSAIAVIDSSLSITNQTKSNPSIVPSRHPPPMPTPPPEPPITSPYPIAPKSRPSPFLSSFKNHQHQPPPTTKTSTPTPYFPTTTTTTTTTTNSLPTNPNPISPKPHPPGPSPPSPSYTTLSNPIKPHQTPLLKFPFFPSSTTPPQTKNSLQCCTTVYYPSIPKKKSFSKSPKS